KRCRTICFSFYRNIIVHQQVAAPAIKGWNTGLFDCCQDMNSCCYGFWCCPCLACSTTGEFGESTCLPLVDIIGPACMVAFGVPIIVPPASLSMRVAVRHKYGIQV
uniref:Plac8 onzin related protein 6 n=1 Tax=Hucho hucho TaxID=62062 RepID=A0A4W5N3Y6_9TELE